MKEEGYSSFKTTHTDHWDHGDYTFSAIKITRDSKSIDVGFMHNNDEQFFFHTVGTNVNSAWKYDIDDDYLSVDTKHFTLNDSENGFLLTKLAKSKQTIKSLVKNIILFCKL